ncbi:MAG TPA: hypothetical protein VGI81_19745 [Tepidisphaeraceae bacterium]|jgi:hypothetical protein
MRKLNRVLGVLVIAGMAFAAVGCTKSETETAKNAATGAADATKAGDSTSGGGATASSAMDEPAKAAAMAEIQRHWAKKPDGWVTARISGSAYAPDRYLRQLREITVAGVESFDLSESDKMNGFEWAGQVTFRKAPCREVGDQGFVLEGMSNLGVSVERQRGRWSQWVDFQPDALHLQKVKGQWQIPQDQWMTRGNLPTAQDFANAGVK